MVWIPLKWAKSAYVSQQRVVLTLWSASEYSLGFWCLSCWQTWLSPVMVNTRHITSSDTLSRRSKRMWDFLCCHFLSNIFCWNLMLFFFYFSRKGRLNLFVDSVKVTRLVKACLVLNYWTVFVGACLPSAMKRFMKTIQWVLTWCLHAFNF